MSASLNSGNKIFVLLLSFSLTLSFSFFPFSPAVSASQLASLLHAGSKGFISKSHLDCDVKRHFSLVHQLRQPNERFTSDHDAF